LLTLPDASSINTITHKNDLVCQLLRLLSTNNISQNSATSPTKQ